MLNDLAEFERALNEHFFNLWVQRSRVGLREPAEAVIGDMYCVTCGDSRKMGVLVKYPSSRVPSPIDQRDVAFGNEPLIVCMLRCVQCDTKCTAVKYEGPDGPGLVVLLSSHGGLSTPHTPASVAYYLDQAHKSHSVGANSAALAMFRAALEHLLYEQGFSNGMLNKKISDLDDKIKTCIAPAWARDLDTEYLRILKELGNGAIHTNGGDIKKQAHIDSNLVIAVEATFAALLQIVYEIPQKKAASLAALKAKAAFLK